MQRLVRQVVERQRVAAAGQALEDHLQIGLDGVGVRDPEHDAVRAHRRDAEGAQQAAGDRQVGERAADELLEADDADDVAEQPRRRASSASSGSAPDGEPGLE